MLPNPCKWLASVTNVLQSIRIVYEVFTNMVRILFPCEFLEHAPNFRNISKFSPNASECLQMQPNAPEFLVINANLLKIAFGRAFAREIRYMGELFISYSQTLLSHEHIHVVLPSQ